MRWRESERWESENERERDRKRAGREERRERELREAIEERERERERESTRDCRRSFSFSQSPSASSSLLLAFSPFTASVFSASCRVTPNEPAEECNAAECSENASALECIVRAQWSVGESEERSGVRVQCEYSVAVVEWEWGSGVMEGGMRLNEIEGNRERQRETKREERAEREKQRNERERLRELLANLASTHSLREWSPHRNLIVDIISDGVDVGILETWRSVVVVWGEWSETE